MKDLEKKYQISWAEFRIGDLFNILSSKKIFHACNLKFNGKYRYVTRRENNNGIKGYITEDEHYLNPENTISFGQDTATIFYQDKPYFTGNKVKIMQLKKQRQLNKNIAQFLITSMQIGFTNFQWGSSYEVDVMKKVVISLPVTPDGEIAFDFIEEFIQAREVKYFKAIKAYLAQITRGGTLHRKVNLENIRWAEFNLEKLFGKSTRGKRLKSADRIKGHIPFVTAGEENTGISAFVGNDIHIFKKNTITIDMFGSAKYRNYDYGADDHVAVVHTEKLKKEAVLFITSAINKVAHTGQFDYSRNFYAKDADNLTISLPVTPDGTADYEFMEIFINALEKKVIEKMITSIDQKINIDKTLIH